MLKNDGLPVEYHRGCGSKRYAQNFVVAMDSLVITVLGYKLSFSVHGDGAVLKIEVTEVV